jgi:hypothetical protein
MGEQEFLTVFKALSVPKQLFIGKWSGRIALMKSREQWAAAYKQILDEEPELLCLVKYLANKLWVIEQAKGKIGKRGL